MSCSGTVVRVENNEGGSKFAVAAAINSYEFVAKDEKQNVIRPMTSPRFCDRLLESEKAMLWLGLDAGGCSSVLGNMSIGEVFQARPACAAGSGSGGTRVLSGSQVAAGDVSRAVEAGAGRRMRICPKTSLSVSSDPSGKSLCWG